MSNNVYRLLLYPPSYLRDNEARLCRSCACALCSLLDRGYG